MPEAIESRVEAARAAVERYREAHARLYKERPANEHGQAHQEIFDVMLKELEAAGFTDPEHDKRLAAVWAESGDVNAKELGYKDAADLRAAVEKGDTEALNDLAAFEAKWK